MEDKKITPQESMEIISEMIQTTKRRMTMQDLKIFITWGLLAIGTALVVGTLLLLTHNKWFQLFWFLIPLVGVPCTLALSKKARKENKVKTFVDSLTNGIWKIVGYSGLGLMLLCVAFSLFGYHQLWISTFFFAFIIVGFGAAMQGVVVRENSYVFGGLFSIVSGFFVMGLYLCNIPLSITWCLPLYILCFLLMCIVPAGIVAKKIKRGQQ
ncbi:MAG: hypothetical protein NC324_06990 [Bacteroides sp.]|nr:hypothetical protein [Bacteroides sp.]MCM1085375.1 hypothetical protein [Bacteroides sp.]MCM1169666.1 hypothetical protein [Bacteroides sp.]